MKSLYMYVIHRDQIVGGKKQRIEEVHFKYRIQKSLYDQSTFVVDMGRQRLEKSRLDRTYDEVVTYLAKSHEEVARYKEMMDAANAAKVQVIEQVGNDTPVDIKVPNKTTMDAMEEPLSDESYDSVDDLIEKAITEPTDKE